MYNGCCVSCGEAMERGPNGLSDHHCSKKHEGALKGANTRGETPREYTKCYADRLSDGFWMLNDEYTGRA